MRRSRLSSEMSGIAGRVIGETESLCPVCLRRVPARNVVDGDDVYLEKSCRDHGYYKTLIWRGAGSYVEWGRHGEELGSPARRHTLTNRGCPYDCGLCPSHLAETCVTIMEVTPVCNLACPVCFAGTAERPESIPSLDVIGGMYRAAISAGVKCPIQLSGGEPTTRDDLSQIVAMGREIGFEHIQVNTNGIRIAEDIKYLEGLKRAGLSVIYLQFDSTTDDIYLRIRGRELLQVKLRAIQNCAEVKLGVILVPTLVADSNLHQVGDIVSFAKSWIPVVKGIHFQPITYVGRYPSPPPHNERVTIPDVLFALEGQTGGEIRVQNLSPRRRKESYCSFGGFFVLSEEGELMAVSGDKKGAAQCSRSCQVKLLPYEQARRFVGQRWRFSEEDAGSPVVRPGSWESFYRRARTHYLSITCMPFQDAWSIDLERLKRCCTHVVTPARQIVPFCAYYLTDTEGRRLHRPSGGRDVS